MTADGLETLEANESACMILLNILLAHREG